MPAVVSDKKHDETKLERAILPQLRTLLQAEYANPQ
jgi:hypothetical protein